MNLTNTVDYYDFEIYLQVGTNVQDYVTEEKPSKGAAPYLLCLGSKIDPKHFFVIIDEEVLPCPEGATAAMDMLFKVHHVFNVEYAEEMALFYTFLENYIYNIRNVADTVPSKVIELHTSIRSIGTKEHVASGTL